MFLYLESKFTLDVYIFFDFFIVEVVAREEIL